MRKAPRDAAGTERGGRHREASFDRKDWRFERVLSVRFLLFLSTRWVRQNRGE